MTTMEEIKQSIKDLVEAQKNAEGVRRKTEEEAQRKIEEVRKETEEARRKSLAEVDKKIQEGAEAHQKGQVAYAELVKTVNKISGDFGNAWGKFIEDLVTPNAVRLLEDRGIDVRETFRLKRHGSWEIDSLAVNGIEFVALEVKKHLKKKHITRFLEVLTLFKKESDLVKNKILYGGIAFLSCEKGMEKYAQQQGLFVFQATGNSAVLLNPKHFKPKPIT